MARPAITRQDPGCLVYLLDQSSSMRGSFGGEQGGSKAEGLADAINRLLTSVGIISTKFDPETETSEVRNYFQVSVFGYGMTVGPAFIGEFVDQELVWINDLADRPAKVVERLQQVPDGAGGLTAKPFNMPVWFEPVAENGTPMKAAFKLIHPVLEKWVGEHPKSNPPIVMNLTDAEFNEGQDPSDAAAELMELRTDHGHVLVFNCHLSSKKGSKLLYPDSEDVLPDEHARRLFRISSVLPPEMVEIAQLQGLQVTSQSRGFVFNADLTDVIKFLNVGTPKDLD